MKFNLLDYINVPLVCRLSKLSGLERSYRLLKGNQVKIPEPKWGAI
jgi:hypothetical protein